MSIYSELILFYWLLLYHMLYPSINHYYNFFDLNYDFQPQYSVAYSYLCDHDISIWLDIKFVHTLHCWRLLSNLCHFSFCLTTPSVWLPKTQLNFSPLSCCSRTTFRPFTEAVLLALWLGSVERPQQVLFRVFCGMISAGVSSMLVIVQYVSNCLSDGDTYFMFFLYSFYSCLVITVLVLLKINSQLLKAMSAFRVLKNISFIFLPRLIQNLSFKLINMFINGNLENITN